MICILACIGSAMAGAAIGFFAAALLHAAKRADTDEERVRRRLRKVSDLRPD
jgi:hypothetical protein